MKYGAETYLISGFRDIRSVSSWMVCTLRKIDRPFFLDVNFNLHDVTFMAAACSSTGEVMNLIQS